MPEPTGGPEMPATTVDTLTRAVFDNQALYENTTAQNFVLLARLLDQSGTGEEDRAQVLQATRDRMVAHIDSWHERAGILRYPQCRPGDTDTPGPSPVPQAQP